MIDEDEGAGGQLVLERTAGRKRDEVGNPCPLERVDIGAVVDIARREPVPFIVTRQEHDRQGVDLADPERGRRLAPRTLDTLFAHILEAWQVVKT